ncbi:hypothetical protein [Treponema sp. J25]|uniref:hypothetical protein n=1 Tax=Treponema sp. J25 TaxID=2094121 RepID=UPI001043ACF0|nr:hypothetical protein [Treponema sp. J25]
MKFERFFFLILSLLIFFSCEQVTTVSQTSSGSSGDSGSTDGGSVVKRSYKFDFQPADTSSASYYTADGYTAITVDATATAPRPCTEYTTERGYGFITSSMSSSKTLNARDRGATLSSDYALRDLVTGNFDYTFKVDVINGDYTITAWVGDTSARTTTITITDGNATLGTLSLSSAANSFDNKSLDVAVTTGTLEFTISDSANVRALNAITIVEK